MDPETLIATNENMYRVALMLIQGITVMVGLGSALFMVICTVFAAYDYFAEMGRSARRQIKPVSLVGRSALEARRGPTDYPPQFVFLTSCLNVRVESVQLNRRKES
jgi:hypothetical protein